MTTTIDNPNTETPDDRTLEDTGVFDDYTIGAITGPNHRGDATITWDSRSTSEVEAARDMFSSLRGRGHLAYKAGDGTPGSGRDYSKGDQITEFDPRAERIVMVAPIQGG